jgi:tetratricopeptide (TPR) repeat protein
MKNLISALMIPAVCLTLAADSTGRIAAKVTAKDGTPIAGATILLERVEITWAKTITTNAKGAVLQVGLEPKEFNITVSANGYVPLKARRKIPLADTLAETFVLLTPDEARAAAKLAPGQAAADPSAAKEEAGSTAFNTGVEFYNAKNFAEALPFIEQAYQNMVDASTASKDATAKAELDAKLPTIERVYGITLVEVGKSEEAKNPLALKAEPFLTRAFEKNPKDQRVILSLLDLAQVKKDEAMTAKYQAVMDAIIGPRPELAYNEATAAFNAGKYKEAKIFVTKAIATDPKFAESYYLLGVVEYSLGNTKAAKESFRKYMEIAPTGKKAGEVKEFLKELK